MDLRKKLNLSFFKEQVKCANFVIAMLFLLPSLCWSQHLGDSISISFGEKIYLQLTNKVYSTNETIWFKSIITDAVFHKLSKLSGVLYVELINSNEEVIDSKTLKIVNGIGNGFFELNPNYKEGTYLIRAYTQWNKNFGADFIFQEYIQLFANAGKKTIHPISNITLLKKTNESHLLKAIIDPFAIDSLHKKKVTLYLKSKDRRDSLILKKDGNGKFSFDHIVADTIQFVTLQVKTKNAISQPKTIAIDQDYLDFQFFPEGGELVHGISSKVGFKALDVNGNGKKIEGVIVNSKEEVVSLFKSNSLGMGSFTLRKADSMVNYFAKITSKADVNLELKYPLPKVNEIGNVLSVFKKNDKLELKVISNYLDNDVIKMRVSCRGLDYFEVKGKLKKGELKSSIDLDKLPEGILAITLLDNFGNPLAERLFFNQQPENRVQISIDGMKAFYKQREITDLQIKTNDSEGRPLKSNLSILVLNKNQIGKSLDTRQDILSYLLLCSDIKGRIQNPSYYFQENEDREADLDDLLITQGWRKYKYIQPRKLVHHDPESQISVSGEVSSAFSAKKKKTVKLTLATFGNPKTFDVKVSDSLGRFKFDIEDSYGKPQRILIQSVNEKGNKKSYSVKLDKRDTPSIEFNKKKLIQEVDSISKEYVLASRERARIDKMFELSSDVNQLDEVEITSYKMTPQRSKVQKEHGDPDFVIKGKEIRAKEKKWSYGLYSVILFNYPDKIEIIEVGNSLYAKVVGSPSIKSGGGVTLVVIDGTPVSKENYHLIPNIPPSEVSSFEIIKSANGFFELFMQVFPRVHPLNAPKFGSVIAIYTHAGKGLHGVSNPVGLLHASVPVFSPIKEFYKPKYENLVASDWLKPDLRALVHWEPNIWTDSKGKSSTYFYNSDNLGEQVIMIEAISENGDIGYQTLTYEIEKLEE